MERPNKILVAFDGSPQSKKALEWSLDLSQDSNGAVIAVYVSEPVHLTSIYGIENGSVELMMDTIKETEINDRKTLEEAKAFCVNRGRDVKTELLHGNIAQAIIKYAKEEQVDLIVTGTKGHGALGELLLGSVTRNLVSLAHIPVLVVKD